VERRETPAGTEPEQGCCDMAGTLYVGMDLGKGFHQVAVVDEHKETVGTPFRVNRGSRGIEMLLRQLRLYGAEPADVELL
jgi:hypothetical protein